MKKEYDFFEKKMNSYVSHLKIPVAIKKILFVARHAPFGTSKAQEMLDIILMASTFEQEISIVFLDEGVLQLKKQQDAKAIMLKNFTQTFKALSLYGIEKVYVAAESLQQFGLTADDLLISVTVINNARVTEILQQQDTIVSL